jgi:hypothetical protein
LWSYIKTKTDAAYLGINANAVSATKATQDGDGETISSTYLKLSGGTLTGVLTGTRAHFTTATDASETSNANVALRLGPATG